MKKLRNVVAVLGLLLCGLLLTGSRAYAAEITIANGVKAGNLDLSGLTKEEAKSRIEGYMAELGGHTITLKTVEDKEVTVTADDLGLAWGNPEMLDEAVRIGKQGNVVQRYKAQRMLASQGKTYQIALQFDENIIRTLITEQIVPFDHPAVNASLSREGGEFKIVEGSNGYACDVEASVQKLQSYLENEWDDGDAVVALVVTETKPQGDAATLAQVKDVLGTFTTSYKTSGSDRCTNIATGCAHLNGTTVYPGEQISVLGKITPFNAANGYELAGSYLNGQVVESFGGGICQVSTTLYNAVLRSELQVDERSNHSMIINYVKPAEDAAIAENGGKDFKFTNNTDYPIYIEGSTANKTITFTIYGVETRDPGHKVSYESEVLETTVPPTDNIIQDAAQPVGYCVVNQGVHVGYKAQLWKIVSENGVETSRELVNTSTYKAVPRTVTVGVSTPDPNVYAQMQAAIATGSYDQVKAVAAAFAAPAPAPAPEAEVAPAPGQ